MNLFYVAAYVAAGHAGRMAVPPPPPVSRFDVVITEIMADPTPVIGLPDAEYVEIRNRSGVPVPLAGWTLYDGSSRILPACVLMPGSCLIICNDDDTALFTGLANCSGVTSLSLTNSGEKISLRDPTGFPIDSVTFSSDWYGDSPKQDGGWSLERVDVNFTCLSELNWKPSENPSGGTPGSTNSVAGTIYDPVPPVLLRAFCPDSLSVELVFSEALDSSARNLQYYHIFNAPEPVAVDFAPSTKSSVIVTLQSALTAGKTGTVKVTHIPDCAGNQVLPGNSARFAIADTTGPVSMTINEILFHPDEGGYDFIELINTGTKVTDLRGARIRNYDTGTGLPEDESPVSEEPWLMFPGDIIVLTENPVSVALHYPSSYPLGFISVPGLPAMNVDEGIISIIYGGITIDSVHYLESFHFELLNDPQGVSLEKINPEFPSSDPESWHSASPLSGSASPGLRNTQFTESVPVEKGLLVMPELFSPGTDGFDDVVTFSVAPGKPGFVAGLLIFNSDGQVVYTREGVLLPAITGTFSWDGICNSGIQAPSGIYLAYLELFHPDGEIRKYRAPFVVAPPR